MQANDTLERDVRVNRTRKIRNGRTSMSYVIGRIVQAKDGNELGRTTSLEYKCYSSRIDDTGFIPSKKKDESLGPLIVEEAPIEGGYLALRSRGDTLSGMRSAGIRLGEDYVGKPVMTTFQPNRRKVLG